MLAELKVLQKQEHKTLGRLVSELLTAALSHQKTAAPASAPWMSRPMYAKVDLTRKDALHAALGEQ